MRRGEIWWVSLPDPQGSLPGYRRPVLIIQSDAFNASKINTVIVLALTGNLRLAGAPGNVLLESSQSQLPRDSVINVSQVLTIDKAFLTEHVASLSPRIMNRVADGVRLVLSL